MKTFNKFKKNYDIKPQRNLFQNKVGIIYNFIIQLRKIIFGKKRKEENKPHIKMGKCP